MERGKLQWRVCRQLYMSHKSLEATNLINRHVSFHGVFQKRLSMAALTFLLYLINVFYRISFE